MAAPNCAIPSIPAGIMSKINSVTGAITLSLMSWANWAASDFVSIEAKLIANFSNALYSGTNASAVSDLVMSEMVVFAPAYVFARSSIAPSKRFCR